jgi:N-acetylgalactosamine-6-sulfatase
VKDNSTNIAAVDLLPTFCAAAGVSLPGDYRPDGENMLPAFEGHPVVRTKSLYWEWRGPDPEPDYWPRLAVREGDWKLVMDPAADRLELHNLAADPHERNNLASKEPDRARRMSKMAIEWRDSLPKSPPADCISKQELPVTTKKAKGSRGTD